MQRSFLSRLIIGFLLICQNGGLFADEADELRAKAKELRRAAGELSELRSKAVNADAVKLLKEAERLEERAKESEQGGSRVAKQGEQLKERLGDLLAKERKMRESKASEQEL